ncbi:MAG: ABC transporter permease [Spirochaetales bacterium]|nr:ABC transporter permease [Spirochaetales bacterium]
MRRQSHNITLAIILVAVVALISLALPNKFLTVINFESMTSQFPEFGLLALAMLLAMLTGGIDLSVVSTANLSGVIAALVLANLSSVPVPVVILLAILAGIGTSAVCGLFNGTLITQVGVPPILATLGTQGLFLGIAVIITKGYSIGGFPEEFLIIGTGQLAIFPLPLIIFSVVALLIALMLRHTKQGFHMYMLGSSSTVARFSGVNNRRIVLNTYLLSGILSGLAAIVIISRVNSMRPGYGYAYLLQAVLVVILGGTDPNGGFGSVLGVVMAVVLLQVIQSGSNILAFTPFFKKFMWGFMLLLVMVINYFTNRFRERGGRIVKEVL